MSVVIRAEHLSKVYGTQQNLTYALNDVSLTVAEGEFIAIIGASGSGKSTLMNILGCLDRPTHGKYFLEDHLVSSLSEGELAKIRNQKIGFVFQSFNLLPRTAAIKNVELPLIYNNTVPRSERFSKAKVLLEMVGLGEKLDARPNQLSGGQQQRVAIARALVNNPRIIFADEPTGNLDSKASKDIMHMFKQINNEKRTIVMVTHEQDVARQAKRIITVKDGKMIADTTT